MHCIDLFCVASRCPKPRRSGVPRKSVSVRLLVLGPIALLSACSTSPRQSGSTAPAPVRSTTPSVQAPVPGLPGALPGPRARNWDQFKLLAAERIVAASPNQVYQTVPPDVLLAVPVLQIELNRDGSLRQVSVLRYPRQARDTVEVAIAAVRRAAPFGDVSHLPRPWQFTESFLFNDARKFKPRTLDR